MARHSPHLRAVLEARIEDAIALLDLLDGDPDREPEVDGCEFEDDARGHPAHAADSEDFECDAWETFDQRWWVNPPCRANQTSAQRRVK